MPPAPTDMDSLDELRKPRELLARGVRPDMLLRDAERKPGVIRREPASFAKGARGGWSSSLSVSTASFSSNAGV